MDHRFETFSLSILELNRYLQKIKELEMKQFGLKAITPCVSIIWDSTRRG